MENPEQEQPIRKDSNKIYFLVAVILALLGTNTYLFFKDKKANDRIVTVSDEKTRMQTEIDKIEADLANQKEMLDSVLENDSTYKDHAERAKEASRIKTATKKEIFKRPDVSHVVVKLNEIKDDIKNTKEELSQYVQEYARVSGQNYFEAADGSIQEIVYVAKLRKKQA